MINAYICDAVRTPFGRYGGALSAIRADDLAAIPLRALMERNAGVDWAAVDDVIFGCANQAGEDNRNLARMALLLAGLPDAVPGATVKPFFGALPSSVEIAWSERGGHVGWYAGLDEDRWVDTWAMKSVRRFFETHLAARATSALVEGDRVL